MNRRYPTIRMAIEIHDDQITQFGGESGLRGAGSLESALMRPHIGYYDGIVEEAAALMESLAINHPFVDGNKRISFFVTDLFLRMNGQFIDCDSIEAYEHFMRLFDTNSFRFAELVGWLSDNVRPLATT